MNRPMVVSLLVWAMVSVNFGLDPSAKYSLWPRFFFLFTATVWTTIAVRMIDKAKQAKATQPPPDARLTTEQPKD